MRNNRRALYALLAAVSAHAMSVGTASAQPGAAVEEIVVTAEKRAASIQDVPIAVSAFTPETLENLQIQGGPNLVTAIPNVNFSKGNFTGYNFQIRGVGTKLVSATADAATGVHLNGVPLTANTLFEAEFYDVERVEVLRGPQGTLYGRNATGGVVNVITAKPIPAFEAFASVTGGEYDTLRTEGMINVPIGDVGGLRLAGTTLDREGYVRNLTTGNDIDGRSLWAMRATLGFDMGPNARTWLSYEKFEEDDDRLRSGKQLCIKDPSKTSVGGTPVNDPLIQGFLSQGCRSGDVLNSRDTVNGAATLGGLLGNLTGLITGDAFAGKRVPQDLRTIEAAFDPIYRADQEILSFNFEWDITDALTLTWLSSHNTQSVFSNEDYNKVAAAAPFNAIPAPPFNILFPGGVVNDPQLGASNQFRTYDISRSSSEQTTSELRLQSSFDGPLNFNVGGIVIDYETVTDYYVFSNTLTAFAQIQNFLASLGQPGLAVPIDVSNPNGGSIVQRVNNSGRNYFLSRTPYRLDAHAVFGELYWDVTDTLKLTAGLRHTNDEKEVINNLTTLLAPVGRLPLELTAPENAYLTDPSQPRARVEFKETTGRFGADWSPNLGFTDDTLIYAFYSKGYKGGGINPPPAFGVPPVQPTYDPEFVNAIEIGTKNTLLQGRLQVNLTGFLYDYEGYQVSKIVNRTSLNENVDAEIQGIELETQWAPTDRLLFFLNAGFLNTEITGGESVDSLDRTQGRAGLSVLKDANAANCVVPTAALATLVALQNSGAAVVPINPANPGAGLRPLTGADFLGVCSGAFAGFSQAGNPFGIAVGSLARNPAGAPYTGTNVGDGVPVNLSGKELPNSPEWTISIGGEYTQPLGGPWELSFRGDYYYQGESYARIYNTIADRLPEWDNLNLSVALANTAQNFEIRAFVRNVLDEEVVTDKYLTDDSSGLFTNVFLLEPRIWGVTASKRF